MPTARVTYEAEVLLTVMDFETDTILSDEDISHAAMEAEVKLNQLGQFEFGNSLVGVRLHLKGEKNGDDQN